MNTLPPSRPVAAPGAVGSTCTDHGGLKPAPHHHHAIATPSRPFSVMAWPAWRRVAAVLPLVLALWLGVWWASMGASPW